MDRRLSMDRYSEWPAASLCKITYIFSTIYPIELYTKNRRCSQVTTFVKEATSY